MPIHRLIATVCSLSALGSALLQGADEKPPEVLPQVTVGAGVPLVKVAEFRMREPRFAPAAAAGNDSIYVVGGLTTTGTASATVERLDVQTGQTEIIARLRVARLWHSAVLVGDKIYVVGGATPAGSPSGYSTGVANAMAARRRKGAGIVEGPSATGGLDLESSVEIIDLATGTVSAGPEMPAPRHQFACVLAQNRIYVIGGQRKYRDRIAFTNTTEILDLATNTWHPGVPMPKPGATGGTVVDGGFIVVSGGYNGQVASRAMNVFDPRDDTWRTITPLCRDTSAHSTVLFGHHLFLFGDYERPEQLLAYNLKTKQSETFTLGYTPARHTAAVVCDGRIFVIGGREDKNSEPLDLIQVFAPTTVTRRRP